MGDKKDRGNSFKSFKGSEFTYCDKKGHLERHCYKKKRDEKNEEEEESTLVYVFDPELALRLAFGVGWHSTQGRVPSRSRMVV